MSAAAAPQVRVGQVWADSDKRATGRTVTILDVDSRRATVKSNFGVTSNILLTRFRPTSTGYRLIKDVAE